MFTESMMNTFNIIVWDDLTIDIKYNGYVLIINNSIIGVKI